MTRGKYIRTNKTKEKQSIAMQGKKCHLGKKHSIKSREKMSLSALKLKRSGNKNPNWKGGEKILGGYRYIFKPYHPYSIKSGYIAEHRLVMEKKLGRYLLRKEVVHHINENKLDNRKNNLKLYSSSGYHSVENHLKRDKDGKFKQHQA